MKTKISGSWRAVRIVVIAVLVAGICLAGGCKSMYAPRPPPVTVNEIIDMSKGGMASHDIIQKIRDSGTVYRMQASELAAIKAQGVSDDVINYMQQTYLDSVRRQDINGWYYAYPYGYWGYYPYAGYYPYWGPYPGDTVIIEEHRRDGGHWRR